MHYFFFKNYAGKKQYLERVFVFTVKNKMDWFAGSSYPIFLVFSFKVRPRFESSLSPSIPHKRKLLFLDYFFCFMLLLYLHMFISVYSIY